MKQQILDLLKNGNNTYVSGEELSRALAVSRTAVWKQIQTLRREGYKIDAQSRLGYRLREVPDKLFPGEIREGLKAELLAQNIVYRESVSSTNDLAKGLAAEGAADGTVVIADEQTGGRGRRGRPWVSLPGRGVWVSIILRPRISPAEAQKATLMAAAATHAAIRRVTGQVVGIKWPNDLVCNGRKLVGILTEMSAEMDSVNYLVIGIGTNVNVPEELFPAEVRTKAASLMMLTGEPVSRLAYLRALLEELENGYRRFTSGCFSEILEEWQKNCITLGQKVRVEGPGFTGVAVGTDPDGALLVRKADGEIVCVTAGDVSLCNEDGTYC